MKKRRDEIHHFLNKLNEREISLGYAGYTISKNMHLEDMQLGYSMDSDGRSLVGTNHGEWKENWFFIGYHDESGDPIFIKLFLFLDFKQ